MMILPGILMMLMISGTLFAQSGQNKERPREKLRNALQIRQEMREMEKKVIDNDAELQGMMENMRKLHQQMRNRIDSKLANDAEYQGLKEQLEGMRQEWQKMGPGPEGGQHPEGRQPERKKQGDK